MEEQNYASKYGRSRISFNETAMQKPGYEDKVVDIVLQFPVRKDLVHSGIDKQVSATLSVHMDHGMRSTNPGLLLYADQQTTYRF
jgi:hypothetical protein